MVLSLWVLPTLLPAYEINEHLALNALLKGVYQYGDFKTLDNQGQGAIGLDLELDFNPTPADALLVLLRFADDNALNDHWPGGLAPFAHDLEADLDHINGSQRDHLLEARYTHTFSLGTRRSLALTAGILDSTVFLDDNAYANDELGQFMNDALVNNPVVNLPSYDSGAHLHFNSGAWDLSGIIMHSQTGDEADHSFNYYGFQLARTLHLPSGVGHYRLMSYATSEDFLSANAQQFARLQGWNISADQIVAEGIGIFWRYGQQQEDAAIDYRALWALGLNLNGGFWGRDDDEFGFGYAQLDGGNGDIERSRVFEAYLKFTLSETLALTLDLQYMHEQLNAPAPERTAWLPGLRLIAAF